MGFVPTTSMGFQFNIDYYNNTHTSTHTPTLCNGDILSIYNTKIICKKPTSIIDCCSKYLNVLNISNGNYNNTVGVCLNKTNNEDYSNMYITCGYDKMKEWEIVGIIIIGIIVSIIMYSVCNYRRGYDRL